MSTNKSFSSETSERYSRALFEVANETNELDKIENDFRNFQSFFSSNYPPQILHSQTASNFNLSKQNLFLTGKFLCMKTHVILNE